MQPSRPSPPGPSIGTHEPFYRPGMVPPGLNHSGAVPPGHYPSGQISFLVPPPGIYMAPIMATLSLPNLTIGITIWYLDPPAATPPGEPKPYLSLTLVQWVPLTSLVVTVPQPPQ